MSARLGKVLAPVLKCSCRLFGHKAGPAEESKVMSHTVKKVDEQEGFVFEGHEVHGRTYGHCLCCGAPLTGSFTARYLLKRPDTSNLSSLR